MANTVVANTSAGLSGDTLLTDPVDLTSQVTGQLPSANLPNSGVTANTYGDSTHVAQVTVNAKGIVTGVSNAVISSSGATISTGAEAAIPAAGTAGNLYLPNDGYWVQRDTGAAWVPWGPIYPFTDPALSGLNTWVNQSTGSISSTNGGLTLTGKPVNAANDSQAYVKTAPATPYTITAAYLFNSYNSGAGAQHGSLVWRESSSGKLISVGIALTTAGPKLSVLKWNSPSSASAVYTEGFVQMGSPVWMQISDDGANRIVRISTNGNDWVQIHSVGRTDFLTANQVGIFVTDSTNRTPVMTLLSWKET